MSEAVSDSVAGVNGEVASRYLSLATSQAGSLMDAQRITAQVGAEAHRLAGLADVRDQLGDLEELSSYLRSAETIDQNVIAAFERRLLSLEP